MLQGDSLNEDSSDDKPHAWTCATGARVRGLARGACYPRRVLEWARGCRRALTVVGIDAAVLPVKARIHGKIECVVWVWDEGEHR
jgi:hypothetical protein